MANLFVVGGQRQNGGWTIKTHKWSATVTVFNAAPLMALTSPGNGKANPATKAMTARRLQPW